MSAVPKKTLIATSPIVRKTTTRKLKLFSPKPSRIPHSPRSHTCSRGVLSSTCRVSSGSRSRRAMRRERRNRPAASARAAASGVTSSARSVGSKTRPWSREYSRSPSVVAAAQARPVGASANARDRTTARRRPPVPGRLLAPAAPPGEQNLKDQIPEGG